MPILHEEITGKIISSFYKVYNSLGYGFLEKVYENAFSLEMINNGMKVVSQKKIHVFYEGYNVGVYYADLMMEDLVIVEIKATSVLLEEHEHQLINYLKATEIEVGLLVNFGKKPGFIRKVFRYSIK